MGETGGVSWRLGDNGWFPEASGRMTLWGHTWWWGWWGQSQRTTEWGGPHPVGKLGLGEGRGPSLS